MATETSAQHTPKSRSAIAAMPCEVLTTHSPQARHFFASRGMSAQQKGQLFSAETRALAVSREIDRMADIGHRSGGGILPYGASAVTVSRRRSPARRRAGRT